MSPDESLVRRIIGSLVLGAFVAAANFALDRYFAHLGTVPATTILNDLIIGAAAALLAYIWVSRQASKHVSELSAEKLTQEAINKERKRMALELSNFTTLFARRIRAQSCSWSVLPTLWVRIWQCENTCIVRYSWSGEA